MMVVTMVMVVVTMIVIVTMVVAMVVRMGVIVAVLMVRVIGRAHVGLERRGQRRDLGGDTGEHRLDLRVAAQPAPGGEDLHRHVAVAEPPGEARERDQIGNARLDQGFQIRHHLDQGAVVDTSASSVASAGNSAKSARRRCPCR